MNNVEEIYTLFSKVVYKSKLKNISKDEKDIILNLIKTSNFYDSNLEDKNSNLHSKSSSNFYFLNDTNILFLKEKILNEFYNFTKKYLNYQNTEFKINTSWIAKSEPNQSSEWHNHNNSWYSGILYIQTFQNCGNIGFRSSENKRYNIVPNVYNILNADQFNFIPEDNMILFFPSQLEHKIFKNNSNVIRYSIAFNILPVGKIGGQGDGQLDLSIN